MKFDYRVKHNGVIYPAGAEVPVDGERNKENEAEEAEKTDVAEEKQTRQKKTSSNKE